MDLSFKEFDYIDTTQHRNDGAMISVYGLDEQEIIPQIKAIDVLDVVSIKDVVDYHDHHELIEAIGDIEKFVEVFGRATILDYLDVNENEEEL